MSSHAPDRGDLVWLEFDPTLGHEQGGRRPALVMSPLAYNDLTGLCVACPITSRRKGFRFETEVSAAGITGVVLADHVRSICWRARNCSIAGQAPKDLLEDVWAKLQALLDPTL